MNPHSGDLQYALAQDRISRLRDEANRHRLARLARGQRSGVVEGLVKSVGRGWSQVSESLKPDRRPVLPAI
ncbi:MAG: hypothetical protein WBZ40_06775 [Acidimicrobiia bacterium]